MHSRNKKIKINEFQNNAAVQFISDAFPSYLSYVDKTYCYQFLNKAYEKKLGVDRSELIGKKVSDVWDEAISQKLLSNVDRALKGEEFTVELNVGPIHSVTSYVPHRDANRKILGVLVFSQDTTELINSRAALIQSEKMAAMGRLAASMLHEINTPISVLKNNNSLIKRSIEKFQHDTAVTSLNEDRLQHLLKLIVTNEAAIDRIVGITKRLKRFTRIDEAPIQEVNIHDCIESAIELVKLEISPRIKLIKHYSQLPKTWARPADLNQLFLNILTNAIESIKGDGKITIRSSTDQDRITVEIHDTGVGIPEDQIERLFQPEFSQTDKRIKASLGLFVCQDIVLQHRGRIKVASEIGRGSIFVIEFPVQDYRMAHSR